MVIDCFTMANELELLDLRFHELTSVVDRFVIVESRKTFSGNPKKLYFEEARERFSKFLPKVTYIVLDSFGPLPPWESFEFYKKHLGFRAMVTLNEKFWKREIFQRNAIMRGLKDVPEDATILISDVDEIPKATVVSSLGDFRGILCFEQKMYVQYLNCQSNEYWFGTKAVHKKDLTNPQDIRLFHEYGTNVQKVKNAGWHFSSLGGPNRIKKKLDTYSHQELNRKELHKNENINWFLKYDINVLDTGDPIKTVPVDATFPRYIRDHINEFRHFIKPEKELPKKVPLSDFEYLKNEYIRVRQNAVNARQKYDELIFQVKNTFGGKAKKQLSFSE